MSNVAFLSLLWTAILLVGGVIVLRIVEGDDGAE
jgi:hypothetical protein